MSTLAPTILQKVQQAKTLLDTHGGRIPTIVPKGQYDPDHTISNTHLLLETLIECYSASEKASYLPYAVDNQIHGQLNSLVTQLTSFAGNPHPTFATNVMAAADSLYSVSLQYGIITFGFDQKELNDLITDLRSRRKNVRKVNPRLPVVELSAQTGEGLSAWLDWLRAGKKS